MTAATAKPARRRRWPWVLAVLAVLLALGAWWINRQLEPSRLTALVLERAGTAMGLELTIDGTPEYALRPEPRLVLPNLVARQPGAAAPLLRAVRAEVSLPWSTITGDTALVITRIELQRPALDLAALAAWQATRPEAPFEVPTLTKGLRIVQGAVEGEDWRLVELDVDLPELRPDAGARANLAGRFEQKATQIDFTAEATLARAALASPLGLAASGRLRTGEIDVPWTLGFDGAFDARTDVLGVDIAKLDLVSESPLPDFSSRGEIRWGAEASIKLDGELTQWPAGWPALPAPLVASESPLAFELGYQGKPDFSAPATLKVTRDQTQLDSRVAVPEMMAWLDQPDAGPLPPLQGTLATPRLEIGGVTLEGVRISIEEDEPAPADDTP